MIDIPGKDVLIVDPSTLVCDSLSVLLGEQGFEAQAAKCGLEALEIMKCKSLDWLCFSYDLGDMDGIELFVRARTRGLLRQQVGCMVTADLRKALIKSGKDSEFLQRCPSQQSDRDEVETQMPCADVHTGSLDTLLYYRRILERIGMKVCISVVRTASENFGKKTLTPILAISSFNDAALLQRNYEGHQSLGRVELELYT